MLDGSGSMRSSQWLGTHPRLVYRPPNPLWLMKPNATSFRVAYERTAMDAAANPRRSQTARARMSSRPRAMHVNVCSWSGGPGRPAWLKGTKVLVSRHRFLSTKTPFSWFSNVADRIQANPVLPLNILSEAG